MDVLNDLQSHISFSEMHIESIHFDQHHAPDLYSIGIYCSILEFSLAIYTLCKEHCITGLEVIFRSLLEAFADLNNISTDESYHLHMEAADKQEWIRVMEKARDSKNLYLASLAAQAEFDHDLKEKKRCLQELKAAGREPLQLWRRFEMAGLKDEYDSIYNQLCTEGHNNIRALTSRHFDIDHEQGTLRVKYRKNSNDGSHDHFITMTSGILLRSGVLIHEQSVQEIFRDRLEHFDVMEKQHYGID